MGRQWLGRGHRHPFAFCRYRRPFSVEKIKLLALTSHRTCVAPGYHKQRRSSHHRHKHQPYGDGAFCGASCDASQPIKIKMVLI